MSQNEWILKAAVEAGVDIPITRLKTMCTSLRVMLPGPKQGSGKNGNKKKIDYVRSLVQHLWPRASADFLKDTIALMMKWKKPPVDLNVLAMVSELDTDNQESFKVLKEHAMHELEAKVFGKGKLAGIESLEKEKVDDVVKTATVKAADIKKDADGKHKTEVLRQWKLTPPELKALLPGGGSIAGVFYMRWHPVQHFWRVTYPTGHLIE